jgi:hypothetical protein
LLSSPLASFLASQNLRDPTFASRVPAKLELHCLQRTTVVFAGCGRALAAFHPYLTLVEGIKLAAQTFTKDVKKLSCCAA